MIAELAYVFHFPPDTLWNMEVDELLWWHERARRIGERLNKT